jgi:hypothetical protein
VHTLDDRYDFNADTGINIIALRSERELEQKACAKSFSVHWEKTDTLKGKIILHDGTIKEQPHFIWTDSVNEGD